MTNLGDLPLNAPVPIGVSSLNADGGTLLTGDVELVSGSNVTLTEGAGTITIAASGGGGSSVGNSVLVYRYTVTGSDKASIDTGVDTPDAGSNDWTNGDLLEAFILARTNKAATQDSITITVNNDTSSIYDRMLLRGLNTTVSAANVLASAGWVNLNAPGANATAGWAVMFALTFPGYAGTAWKKIGNMSNPYDDTTAANFNSSLWALGYGSTSAISRMAVSGQAGQKLKVGSELLIYKRLAS